MIDSNKPQKAEQMVEYLEGHNPDGANVGDIRGMSAMAAAMLCGRTVNHGGTKLQVARMVWFDQDGNKCLKPFTVDDHGAELFANGAPTKATFVRAGRKPEEYAPFLADWEKEFAEKEAEKAKHAEVLAAQAALEAAHAKLDAAHTKLDELTTEPAPVPLVTEGQLQAAAPVVAPGAPVAPVAPTVAPVDPAAAVVTPKP